MMKPTRPHDPPGRPARPAEADPLDRLLQAWPPGDPAPDLRPAVLARVREDLAAAARRGLRPRWWARPAWAAAAWAMGGAMAGFLLCASLIGGLEAHARAEDPPDAMVAMLAPADTLVLQEFAGFDDEPAGEFQP